MGRMGNILSLLHLSEEQEYSEDNGTCGITEHPPNMREDTAEISRKQSTLHINRVNKGKSIGYLLKGASNEVEIEPYTREPCGKICQ